MTTLILPVRPGDNNEELKFAMRSWEQNLLLPSGLDLITVGHKPDWMTPDQHLDGNFYHSVPAAVWTNVLIGSQFAADRGDDQVLYMNDDFYCMDPMESVLPVKRNISLAEHCRLYPNQEGLWWPQSLALTASWLSDEGFTQPDSYEVHRPLLGSPRDMVQALSRWSGGMDGDIPQWRTVYGVLNGVEAYPVPDVKLGPHVTGIGSPWISTSDATWRKWRNAISRRFQKPSRWEN